MADRMIVSAVAVRSVAFTADGKSLAGLCGDSNVRLWDLASGAQTKAIAWTKSDSAVALQASAGGFAMVGSDTSMRLIDFKTGTAAVKVAAPGEKVRKVEFSPMRNMVAGGSAVPNSSANSVRVWDAAGKLKYTVPAGIGGISVMAFSPDGATLVAASYDADVRAWSVKDGELLRLVDELNNAMFAAVFSPDSKTLATAGSDGVIYLWDAKTWKPIRKIAGQPELISSLAYSPDGARIVSGGFDSTTVNNPTHVIVWDAASGKQLHSFDAKRQVTSVAVSPDGKSIAAAAGEKSVSVWDA